MPTPQHPHRLLFVGASNIVMQRDVLILKHLAERGFAVHLCLWDREGAGNPDAVRWATERRLIQANSIPDYARQAAQWGSDLKPDLVYFSSFLLFPWTIGIKKRCGAKLLFNYHDFPLFTTSYKIARKLRMPWLRKLLFHLLKPLENHFLRHTDGVTGTPLVESEMARIERNTTNLEVLINAPLLNTEPVEGAHWEKVKDLRYVIYSGAMGGPNGLELMLQGFAKLAKQPAFADLHFILAGKMDNVDAATMERLMAATGVAQRIHYLGWLPYAELLPILQGAKLGYALYDPNYGRNQFLAEGTLRKPYTYMPYGVPTLTNTHLCDVVVREGAGAYVAYDVDAITQKSMELLTQPELLEEMGQRGRMATQERYNWEIESQKIDRVMARMELEQ
uniref:Putative GT4 n=1 Tax=Magnetococcus massalia (strain MO-1) TaxID=451514 RepID=A0A1S7LLA4_MAGMO|nr:putative GT4 [Candidatus Magnetococcus massalia]